MRPFCLVAAGGAAALAATALAAPPALYPAPRALVKRCSAIQAKVDFRVLCPTLLPRADDGSRPQTYGSLQAGRFAVLGAGYGVPYDPAHWEWNRPGLFLHFVVFEGDVPDSAIELSGPVRRPRLLGVRKLGGRWGRLYEQVPYSVCGCGLGGHLTFVWRERGATYAASLHRWSREETLALLSRLVASLAPPGRS